MEGDSFSVPNEIDFLESFGIEPVESDRSDGYWSYLFEDSRSITLQLSFNLLEKSVATRVWLSGQELDSVYHEGAEDISIEYCDDRPSLRVRFNLSGVLTEMSIQIFPLILIHWSTLNRG